LVLPIHVTDTQRDEFIVFLIVSFLRPMTSPSPRVSHVGYLPITYSHRPYFKQRTYIPTVNLKDVWNITTASFRIFVFSVHYLAADMKLNLDVLLPISIS
jgi:hypothetical protein